MKKMPTIEIMAHPVVWKLFDYNGCWDGVAYDITGLQYYRYYQLRMQRKKHIYPNWYFKREENDISLRHIYVKPGDIKFRGQFIDPIDQSQISTIIKIDFINQMCNEMMLSHILGGLERAKVLKAIFEEYCIDDSVLKSDSVKKYYQRHYSQQEDNMYQYYTEIRVRNKNKC